MDITALNLTGALALGQRIVISVDGTVRVLEEGDPLQAGDVTLESQNEPNEPQVSVKRFSPEDGEVELDQDIANIFAALEEGEDPTELGDEFATAAGQNGSSLATNGTVERDGEETIPGTEFITTGFEALGMSRTQSLSLLEQFRFAQQEPIFVDLSFSALEDAVSASVPEDTLLSGQLTATDANNDLLTFFVESGPSNGSLTLNEDGSWQYTPDANYNGPDSFEVIVTDETGLTDTLTVTIDVTPVNDAPVAEPEDRSLLEDQVISGSINATDVDQPVGEPLVFTTDTLVEGLTLNEDGSYEFDASSYGYLSEGEELKIEVPVTVTDDQGATDTTTLTITVTGTNDLPIANADTGTVQENSTVTVDVLANDTDLDDGAQFTLDSVSSDKGLVTVFDNKLVFEATGEDFDHLPEGVTEQIVVTYTMSDESGEPITSTATITVTGTNDLPIAKADTGAVQENSTVTVDVLANDTDLDDGATFTLDSVSSDKGQVIIVDNKLVFEATGEDFDHLPVGVTEQVVVTYTMSDESGEPITSTATITVTGTNDLPIANADTGAVQENSTVTIDVLDNDTDLDDGATFTLDNVSSDKGLATIVDNKLVFEATGEDFDHLPVGVTEQVVVTYTMSDESGEPITSTATITVTGTNDKAVISVSDPQSADIVELGIDAQGDEIGNSYAEGQLSVVDADQGQESFNEVDSGKLQGKYGIFTFDESTGDWTYTLNDSKANKLDQGDTYTESLLVKSLDGTDSYEIQVEVLGSNDAPTVGEQLTKTTHEDASEKTLNLLKGAGDVDADATLSIADLDTLSTGLSLATDGYTLVIDPSAFNYLAAGESEQIVLNYNIVDGLGGVTPQTATITVNGRNDKATITVDGEQDSSVVEAGIDVDGNPIGDVAAGGTLKVEDPDQGESTFQEVAYAKLAGKYGTFEFDDATGEWSYSLDDTKADKLDAGDTYTETLVVKSADGKTKHEITVEVKGSNDAPAVGEQLMKTTHEDASEKTLNLLKGADDVDADADLSIADLGALPTGLSLAGDGYTLVIDPSAFNYLAAGESEQIVLNYNVVDGLGGVTSQTATITVNGRNDKATITVDGEQDSSVVEAGIDVDGNPIGDVAAGGTLKVEDPDQGESTFQEVADAKLAGKYGTFEFDDATGEWSYSLDDTKANKLDAGDTYTETLVVKSADGKTKHEITVEVKGSNDAPTVGEQLMKTTHEDASEKTLNLLKGAGDVDADATLSIADLDTLSTGLSLATDGYTLVIDPSAFNYLAAGESEQIVLNYNIVDGLGGVTPQTATITVNGRNDKATITVDGEQDSSVVEAGIDVDGNPIGDVAAGGTLKVEDPDQGESTFQEVADAKLAGKYGTFEFDDATGEWSYSLDDTKADKLDAGDTYTETLVVKSADGKTKHEITVEVKGSNDAPTVGEQLMKTTHEDASEKTLNLLKGADDVDADADLSIADLGALPTGLSLAGDGYTLVIDPSAFNYLAAGESEQIVLNYNVVDGLGGVTSQTATITVNGRNDKATITVDGEQDSSVVEAGIDVDGNPIGDVAAGGTLKVEDPDQGESTFQEVADAKLAGKYGTFEFDDATGEWSYSLDDTKADKLDAGDTYTETLVVKSADGKTKHEITVEVKGSNDAPTVGEQLTKTTHEDASEKTLNLLKGAGDVDADATLSIADLDSLPTGLSLAVDGYTLVIDPSAFNYLAAGESEQIVLNYNVVDGLGGVTPQTARITVNGRNDGPVAIDDTYETRSETQLFSESFENMTNTGRWTVVTGNELGDWEATNGLEIQRDGLIADATDGDYLAELDAHQNTSITTSINTSDQDSVRVEFDYNPRRDGNSSSDMTFKVGDTLVTVHADGSLSGADGLNVQIGQPDANGWYKITAEFEVQGDVTDLTFAGAGASDSYGALLDNITVTGINQSKLVTAEDTSITISFDELLANDTDIDGDELSIVVGSITSATNGELFVDYTNNTITFTPDTDYNGEATFKYKVTDGNGGEDEAEVTLNITPVNDAPVLTGDLLGEMDEAGSYTITAADLGYTDVDDTDTGVTFTVGNASNGTILVGGVPSNHFTVAQLATGEVTFKHDGSETTSASFDVNVEDGNEDGSTPVDSSFNLTVMPVNDAPVAISDSYKNVQETILLTESFENMANPAGWTVVSKDPSEVWDFTNGIEIERDGLIVDATDGDFYAELDPHKNTVMTTSIDTSDQDSLRVEFDYNPRQDGNSSSDMTFTVGNTTITLHADGTVTAPEGTSVTLDGPDNKGWYQVNAEFDVSSDATLIAFAGAGKSDSLGAFIDNITVTGIDAPKLITEEDQALTISGSELLANDFDVDGDDITIFSVNATDATNGSVQLIDGNVVFEPNQDFNGEATFEYTIVDTHGEKSTTTVTVNVTPVNDDPIANDDSRALGDNLIVNGSFEDYESVSNAGWGSRIDQLDGWSYDARTGALDSVQEGYAVDETDGDRMIDMEGNGDNVTLTQQIQGVESGTLYQLSFDTAMYERLPSAELEVIWNGEVVATITPESNTMQTQLLELLGGSGDGSNTLSFREVGTEGDKSGTYLDNIKFQEVIKNLQTQEDVTLDIPSSELLSNDSDVDGDTLIILDSLVIDPTYGQVELVELQDGSQTVRYTPADDFNGIATFTYTVSDGKGGTDTAVVTINVTPENDAPIFVKDGVPIGDTDQISVSTKEDNSVSGKVTATDIDDTDLTYTVSQPTNGSVEIDPETGEWKYTPNNEFDGYDSFVVAVSDGNGGTDTVVVNVDVLPVAELTVTAGQPVTEAEEAFLSFEINLNELVSENVALDLTLGHADDTATKGVDYEDKIYVKDGQDYKALSEQELADLIIASGLDSLEVFIKVLDDKLLEGEETVTLKASSTSEFVENDKRDSDTANIVDETDTNDKDTVTVGLTGPDSVVEGDKTSPFTITLSEQVPEDSVVTLQYSYTNASNEDIVEVITVNVDANTNTATFEIQTEQDNEYEVGQEFNVSVVSVTQDDTDVFEKLDTSSADKNVAIDDSHDNPPKAEDFSISLNADGSSQVIFDTGMGTIEGDGTDHISDDEDDNDNDAGTNLGVIITELPDSGTLYYVDGNNKVEVVVGQTYEDPNNIVYEDDQESTGFFLGVDDTSTLDKGPHSTAEFYNWGDEVDAYTRELKFDNGDVVTITSEGRNNVDAKPLVQNNSQQGHMGFGIASTNRGIHQDEAINIDFSSRPADSVTVGLSGLGGWFAPNADDSVQSRAEITVTFDYGNGVTEEQTFLYDDTHNNQNVTIVAPEGAEIVSVEASTQGPGNWELTSLEAKASDSFEYKAVDSDGNESEAKTVTIDKSGDLNANNDPQGFEVKLGEFSEGNDSPWSAEGAELNASFNGQDKDFAHSGIKIGVAGKVGGLGAQIEYDRAEQQSEKFEINLDSPATQFAFSVSNLFKNEGNDGDFTDNHEQGSWVAYLNGVAVAGDSFIAEDGNNKGTYEITPLAPDGTPIAFDTVVFEATEYSNQATHDNDASDYFLTGFKASSEGAYAVNQGGILEIPTSKLAGIVGSELLNNDIDSDGDNLRITYVYGETEGNAYIKDGIVYFDLAGDDFVGETTFKYQVTDDNGQIASAEVNVIVNPLPTPSSVASVDLLADSVVEGDDLGFKVTLDSSALVESVLDVTFGKNTDAANDSGDEKDLDLSLVHFTNGVTYDQQSGKLIVPVGVKDFAVLIPTLIDGVHELDENYSLIVDGVSATGIIENVDTIELMVESFADVAEGSNAVFAVSLNNPSSENIDVSLAITLDRDATSAETADFKDIGELYTAYYLEPQQSGEPKRVELDVVIKDGKPTVTIPNGETEIFVEVATKDDPVFEGGEDFNLVVTDESGYVSNGSASDETTIMDDGTDPDGPDGPQVGNDDRPVVDSITDIGIEEGLSGRFVVELSNSSELETTIEMSLNDGSAVSVDDQPTEGDFNASSVIVSFGEGENKQSETIDVVNGNFIVTVPDGHESFTVEVVTNQDTHADNNEKFSISGNAPHQSQAVTGVATITDNEAPMVDLNGALYDIEFVSEGAGYSNVFGYYINDESGEKQLHVLVSNSNDPSLSPGTLLDSPLSSIDNLEFFLIPNGFNKIDSDKLYDLKVNDQGQLVVDGVVKAGIPVYTSTDEDHQISTTVDSDGNLVLSFDDQKGQGNDDNDFNDFVVKVSKIDTDGIDFNSAYVEEGEAAIADIDADIFDDKDTIKSMSVTLTNAKDGDNLTWAENSGFSVSKTVIGTAIALIITHPSGSVSADEFETFLKSIRFVNSSDTPDEETRLVNVTVSDGVNQSETATTSISVTGTDELSLINVAGLEDQFIDLNISVVDAATSVSTIELSGIPQGATVLVGGVESAVDNSGTVVVNIDDIDSVKVKAPEHSDVNFDISVTAKDSDEETVESGSIYVDVHPDADRPTLIIGDFEKVAAIDFEDVQITSGSWDSDIEINNVEGVSTIGEWSTSNPGQHVEVGTEGTYLSGSSTNQVMEIEGEVDDKVLYTDMDLVAGRFYNFKFDIAARDDVDPSDSDMEVSLFKLDDAGNPIESSKVTLYDFIAERQGSGWQEGTFTLPVELSGKYRLVLEADEADSTGAIIDNIQFTAVDNYGYEDSFIKLSEISASLVDATDDSETLTVELEGLPAGSVLIDGTGQDANMHIVTEANKNDKIDVTGWDLTELQIKVLDPSTFDIKVIATATESDTNKDDDVHAEHGDPGGKLVNASEATINITVLEHPQGPVDTNERPTANDFTISSDTNVANINFAPNATDTEDDASSTDGKYTSVRIEELPEYGKLYEVNEQGEIIGDALAIGTIILDSANIIYVANGIDDVEIGSDFTDVNGVVDIQDEFKYSAIDSKPQDSLSQGTVTINATSIIGAVSSGIDHVTVTGNNMVWNQSAAHTWETESSSLLGYDELDGTIINVGVGGDSVNMGAGSDTVYMGDSIVPGMDQNVNIDNQNAAIDRLIHADINGSTATTADDMTYGDEDYHHKLESYSNAGVDIVQSGGGNDTVYGEEGVDLIFGGTGHDVLNGGSGDDAVRGGSGDDIIVGGLGDDILVGDDGTDLFQWVDQPFQDDVDTITDFDLGEDHLDISQLLPTENSMSDLLKHITIEKVDNGGGDKDLVITISEDANSGGQTQTIILDNTGNQFDSVNAQGDGSVISSDLSNLINQLFVNLPD
ncbi:VCBS domain-containing protein [Vibrio splendidus]|uniref:VCBS domain-containing protein n=1 Tax=Vibrio splendidus TaxID=29497 RepID=UPI0039A65837